MGDVIRFVGREVSLQAPHDRTLVETTIDVLNTNANLAKAIQELADGFVRLDRAFAGSPGDARVRRPIDIVVEQDREKLLTGMRGLLDSISEYTSGVNDRIRRTLECEVDPQR